MLILAIMVDLHHRYNSNLQLHNLAVGQQSLAKTALCSKGIAFRKARGYTVEIRPPKFKKKIWMGTYKRETHARIARDMLTYCTESHPTPQDFNFEYSPKVFDHLTKLDTPFESLHPSCTGDAHKKFGQELKKNVKEYIKYNDNEGTRWTIGQLPYMHDYQNAPTNPSALVESSEFGRSLAVEQDWFDALPSLDQIPPHANLQDISQLVVEEPPISEGELEHRPAAQSVANSGEFASEMIPPRFVFDTGISPEDSELEALLSSFAST